MKTMYSHIKTMDSTPDFEEAVQWAADANGGKGLMELEIIEMLIGEDEVQHPMKKLIVIWENASTWHLLDGEMA